MPPTLPCIEVKNVNFSFGSTSVLNNVSFSVAEGEYLGIIGPNGSGKTTLLKIMVGLLRPDNGSVKLWGEELGALKERFRIGYVPQRASQTEMEAPVSVEEVVASGRTARQGIGAWLTQEDQKAVDRAMEISAVGPLRHRLLRVLSGGERQRVYIARALAGEPRLLILDEPAAGVDIASQKSFYEFLQQLNQQGLTVVIVSHDLDVIAHEAKCVICLHHGATTMGAPEEVVQQEKVSQLYEKGLHKIRHLH